MNAIITDVQTHGDQIVLPADGVLIGNPSCAMQGLEYSCHAFLHADLGTAFWDITENLLTGIVVIEEELINAAGMLSLMFPVPPITTPFTFILPPC